MSVLVLKHIEQYVPDNVSTIVKTIIELLIIGFEVILKYPIISIHLRIYNSNSNFALEKMPVHLENSIKTGNKIA